MRQLLMSTASGFVSSASGAVYNYIVQPHGFPVKLQDRVKLELKLIDPEVLRVNYNTELLARAEMMSKAYELAKETYDIDEVHKDALKTASFALSQEVLKVSKLIQIDPSNPQHQALFDRLIKTEKVHPVEDDDNMTAQEKMLSQRLGMKGAHKDCQALVVETSEGLKLLGQIFRYHADVPVENGMIDVRKIPGNVFEMKSEPCQQVGGITSLTGYWTITSSWPKAGEEIISRLPSGNFETTISPVHGFTKNNDRKKILAMSDHEIRRKVLEYLHEKQITDGEEHPFRRKDGVCNFHVGNGASIGWIHINKNVPPESDDWITINYFYDRSKLTENVEQFKAGELPISEPLQQYLLPENQAPKPTNFHVPVVSTPMLKAA